MKKILTCAAVLAATVSMSNVAHAENTGCGLGTMLFSGNKGVVPNILAVTTNGTSGNQTFGITSGTLGCNPRDTVKSSIKLFAFADENLSELASDTARGNGDYLESVAQILEIKEGDKSHFFNVMQSNFSNIFEGENTNTSNVVASISNVMKKDQVLKSYKI